MKNALKSIVVKILAWQVGRLRIKNQFKVVAVVGSIGKTSTKLAVAQVMQASLRVRYQTGNYNDIVTVPLIFFNQQEPSLFNPLAWVKVFLKNEQMLRIVYPYDVVVVELGTDHPGQIAAFKQYIHADLTVITAISPEHMENFNGLTAIAEEEMAAATFSDKLLINTDLCPPEYLEAYSGSFLAYSIKQDATYFLGDVVYSAHSCSFFIKKDRQDWLQTNHSSFSEPQLYSVLAAAAVSDLLGTPAEIVTAGFAQIKPVPGRMQQLKGIKGSTIIDDTYNASPDAAVAALDTLYRLNAPQKIALLGNMNELGSFSADAHTTLGSYCDPNRLDLVVTLGADANSYLAAAAEKRGCKVLRSNTPQDAGKLIADELQEGGLILAKGSQNKVFAEEAVKILLADPTDESKLVRQSPKWLKIKSQQFPTKTMVN